MFVKLQKQFLMPLLVLLSACLVAGCTEKSESTFKDAVSAFEKNHYRAARVHLANIMTAGGKANDESRLLYTKLMLQTGEGMAAEGALAQIRNDAISPEERLAMLAHSRIIRGNAYDAQRVIESNDLSSEQIARMHIWAHLEQGTLQGNIGLLNDALQRYDDSVYIHALAGNHAISQSDWISVFKHSKRALEIDPDEYEALILEGRVQIFKGDLKTARAFYAKAAENYPDYAIPPANVAGLDMDMGDVDSAAKVLKSALAKHPKFPFLQFQNARLLYEREEYEDARYVMADVLGYYSNYTPAHLLSAKIAAKLGNVETAKLELAKVLSEEPNNNEAKNLLDSLD